jgi:hypothetical protein
VIDVLAREASAASRRFGEGQAENRLHTQKARLEFLLLGR